MRVVPRFGLKRQCLTITACISLNINTEAIDVPILGNQHHEVKPP